jgi:hypothetical protein
MAHPSICAFVSFAAITTFIIATFRSACSHVGIMPHSAERINIEVVTDFDVVVKLVVVSIKFTPILGV